MEDENLLREVVGDDKNDKKRVANLNEENSDDEEVLLSCLLYTSPSPRDLRASRMPSSA